MSISQYEMQCQKVLEAQALRVANEEEHSSICLHEECQTEREARRVLETMPEHIVNQKSWVITMLQERLRKIEKKATDD